MSKVERLPGQSSGIGFVVPVRFLEPYAGWIEDLVDSHAFGATSAKVVEQLVSTWVFTGPLNSPQFGLTRRDAERRGYIPCEFRKIIDPKKFGVHQKMPFLVEFSGMTAYRVDMLSQMRVIGNSREEVARRSAEFKILEYLSEYHEVVQFRSVRGK